MTNEQLQKPSVLPVTIDRLKEHLRVRHDLEESLYLEYLAAATQLLEEWTERAFISRQFKLTIDTFCPEGYQYIELPVTPLVSIESIRYYDADNSPQTLDAVDYFTEQETLIPARIYSTAPAWPTTKTRRDAVEIIYTAGHGDSPEDMPSKVRLVLCQMVEHFNRHRGPMESTGIGELTLSTRTLISSLQVGSYA